MLSVHILKVVLLVIFSTVVQSAKNDVGYNGCQVFRTLPSTDQHYDVLHALEGSSEFKFWTELRKGHPTDIMVCQAHKDKFLSLLNSNKVPFEVFIADVGKIITEQKSESGAGLGRGFAVFNWDDYQKIEDIEAWLYKLGTEYSAIATVQSIGKSYEGRNMTLIKISTGGSGKRAVYIDANIHAREWIGPAVVTYFVNELVTRADQHQDLLSFYDFYIVPNVNPDGYAYSHSKDRLWRKTRSNHNEPSGCLGVDANRNWGHNWGGVGTSPEKCADIYRGPNAFSESEAVAIQTFILNTPVNWTYFLTVHSYDQLCLIPFADGVRPADYDEMLAKGNVFAEAVRAVVGTNYTVGNWKDVMYASSGTSMDWAKAVANIKYSYTIEVRDQGQFGFLLPPNQIKITAEETWAGVKALLK